MTKEELIAKLEENIEKVYFYCVKRCNNRMDAEDLSQTILLEILQNINKGVKINNFDYYIWAICKNQYNRYLKQIVHTRETLDFVEEIDEPGNNISILDEMVYNENIVRMNAAIKLLSKDYSEILYAYYVEDKKLAYIAEELKLPLGTVGRKLSEIREKLKEYLKMEKLNGRKAYVPKDFYGVMAGTTSFDPHKLVERLLVKNLLFHSFRNPCSIEDYSIELGISRPYVEDYVNDLTDKELLVKLEDRKYITNIAFINKNLRKEIYEYVRININGFCHEVIEFCVKHLDEYKRLLINSNIKDEYLLWSFICLVVAITEDNIIDIKYTKHYDMFNNGAEWDYLMLEYLDKVEDNEFFISWNKARMNIGQYDAELQSFPSSIDKNEVSKIISVDRDGSVYDLIKLFFEIKNFKQEELIYSKLEKGKKEVIDKYIKLNYLGVVNDVIVYKTPCITKANYEKLSELIKSAINVKKELSKVFNGIRNIVSVNVSPNLYAQTDFIVSASVINMSQVLTEAYEKGLLKNEEGKYFPYNKLIIM